MIVWYLQIFNIQNFILFTNFSLDNPIIYILLNKKEYNYAMGALIPVSTLLFWRQRCRKIMSIRTNL